MSTTIQRPHVDQVARDMLDDVALIVSEIGSGLGLLGDDAFDAVEVLAQ